MKTIKKDRLYRMFPHLSPPDQGSYFSDLVWTIGRHPDLNTQRTKLLKLLKRHQYFIANQLIHKLINEEEKVYFDMVQEKQRQFAKGMISEDAFCDALDEQKNAINALRCLGARLRCASGRGFTDNEK